MVEITEEMVEKANLAFFDGCERPKLMPHPHLMRAALQAVAPLIEAQVIAKTKANRYPCGCPCCESAIAWYEGTYETGE